MDPQQDDDLEVSRVLFLLRRRAWVPLVVAAIAAVVAFAYSSSQPSLYRATAEVNAVDQGYGLFRNSSQPNPQRDVENAIYLVQSRAVLDPALEQLGSTAAGSVRSIESTSADIVDIIEISVVADSPEVAADAANVIADVFVLQREDLNVRARQLQAEELRFSADSLQEQIDIIDVSLVDAAPDELEALRAQKTKLINQQADLRTRANEFDTEAGLKSGAIRVLVPAEAPSAPFDPMPLRDATLAGLIGLFLGVALVILFDWINSRVTTPEEASRLAGSAPVVGMVPLGAARLKGHKLPKSPREFAAPGSAAEEEYRALATNVRFSALGRKSTVIAVTSPSEGEGKTTTVANLAKALANSGSKVAVVSADLRRPSLGEILGVEEADEGLTTVLLDERPLADVAVSVPCGSGASLLFLPTGPVPANPQAALASDAMGSVLDRLSQAGADIVLLDTAPVLPVSDTLALVHHCHAVLLCVVPNGTKKAYLREAAKRLKRLDAELLGISLDGVRESTLHYYGGGPGSYVPGAPSDGSATWDTQDIKATPTPNESGSNGHSTTEPDAEAEPRSSSLQR